MAPEDPAPVRVGAQIAGYRLMEQIGRGGMAVVYRAIDLRLDRSVALKVLAPELVRDDAFRQRFIRESRAAAAVDHPYIIPVFDAGEADGVLFIAMRYVSGRDVRSLLDRDGTLAARRTVNIIDQVASALDAAHGRGLVHRDVKPANMLLDTATGSGQLDHVYLSDFGLTKQSLSTSSLTSTGQFLGTLDYIAPEQIEGRLVDGRADLYSLACAACEMHAGSPPFRRDQSVAVMWAQISAPPPRLTEHRPDLPPAVDAVLSKALAKKPGDRYQSCLEFSGALREACGLSSGQDAPAGPGRSGPLTEMAQWATDASAAAAAPRGPVPGVVPSQPGPAGSGPGGIRPGGTLQEDEPPTQNADLGARGPAARGPAARGPAARGPAARDLAAPGQAARGPAFGSAAPGPAVPAMPEMEGLYRPVSRSPVAGPQGPPGRPAAGQRPPGVRPGVRPVRRRPWWRSPAAIVVVCLIVAGAAAGGVLYARSSHASPPAPLAAGSATPSTSTSQSTATSSASPTVASGPAGTVTAYFAALNDHNYQRAWNLGGRNTGSTYSTYVQGYSATATTTVHVLSVSGEVVTARITAAQSDGTVKTFQGTYTVGGGVIIQFNVHQTS